MDVSSVVLRSTEGTQSELTVGAREDLRPVLLSTGVCARVALKVNCRSVSVLRKRQSRFGRLDVLKNFVSPGSLCDPVQRGGRGGEHRRLRGAGVHPRSFGAAGAAVPGYICPGAAAHPHSPTVSGHMTVTLVCRLQDGGELALRLSGNPGYVVGRPLLSGTKTAEYPSTEKKRRFLHACLPFCALTAFSTGISRSTELRDALSLLHSSAEQDCLRGPHRRSPVLFGVNAVSGCTLRQTRPAPVSTPSVAFRSPLTL